MRPTGEGGKVFVTEKIQGKHKNEHSDTIGAPYENRHLKGTRKKNLHTDRNVVQHENAK